MAITYLNNISLDNNEIKNVKVDNKTTTQRNAMSPAGGHIIFNSTENEFQFYDGSQWIVLNDTDTDEEIFDLVGSMVSGNSETNITVTYDDANDKLDFEVSNSVIRSKFSIGAEGNAAGNGAIGYDNTTGVFNYTPPVLGGLSGDSDDISEGSTNLYFTNARARSAISHTDAGGDGSFSYDSSTGVMTYTGPSAAEVRAHFSEGTGVTISSGQISIGQSVGTTDNVTFNNVDVDGTLTTDAISTTNLTVTGTTTTVNTETINLADNVITLNSNLGASTAPTQNGGIEVNRGSSSDVSLFFNESTNRWQFQNEVSGSITTYNIPTSEIDSIEAGDGIDVASSGGTTTITAENATSSNPGVAAFDSTDFSIDSDQVVHLAKDPTITLTGDVTGSGTMTNLGNVSISTTVSNNQSFATSIGDGSATSYEVQHSLGTKDVIVQLYDNSSNDTVFADVTRSIAAKSTPNDWIQIDFASAPSSNDIRVLVIKCA